MPYPQLPAPAKLDVIGGGGKRVAVRVGQCGDYRHMKINDLINLCDKRN